MNKFKNVHLGKCRSTKDFDEKIRYTDAIESIGAAKVPPMNNANEKEQSIMKLHKFILIGAGGFGEFWEELFIPKMKDFAIPVAAVDISEEALQLPVKYGTVPAEKCYTDPRKAIEENPCDFLVLVIPPQVRMQYIDLAIEYGLDVVCEKPLADTMEHACEIYVKMKNAGRKLSVTVSHRMEQSKQSLNRLLDSGKYGKLNYIVGRLTMTRKYDQTRRWFDKPEDEVTRHSISGGLIHELDTFRGLARSNAKKVYAKVWKFDPADGSLGSSAFAQVEMENGVRCVLEHSGANATELNGWAHEFYRAECAYGTLVIDKEKLTACCDLGYPYPRYAEIPLAEQEVWDHPMIVRDFCRWLDGGDEPETCIRDNMYCCALTFAAVESALNGVEMDVPEYLAKYQQLYGFDLKDD